MAMLYAKPKILDAVIREITESVIIWLFCSRNAKGAACMPRVNIGAVAGKKMTKARMNKLTTIPATNVASMANL